MGALVGAGGRVGLERDFGEASGLRVGVAGGVGVGVAVGGGVAVGVGGAVGVGVGVGVGVTVAPDTHAAPMAASKMSVPVTRPACKTLPIRPV